MKAYKNEKKNTDIIIEVMESASNYYTPSTFQSTFHHDEDTCDLVN